MEGDSLTVTGPLKWHGGKTYLADRIVALMPRHLHFVEPYFGGGAVLLAKDPEGVSEVVNDVDGRLTNFWRVLQDDNHFARFQRIVTAIPFSEPEWKAAHTAPEVGDPVLNAVAFFVNCRQSMAGRCNAFAPLSRTRTRRNMNEQASAWMTAVDGLPAVHARLRRVVILNRPALDVIQQQDGPQTLFYLDPPYLQSTRTSQSAYGHFEMTEADHIEMLNLLPTLKGRVMLSGYVSNLYITMLSGWSCSYFDLPNNAAGGQSKSRMVECVWTNFKTPAQQKAVPQGD